MTEAINEKLYDRQIRLFGFDTQKKLKNIKIQILNNKKSGTAKKQKSNSCYVSGEILKNLVLLGVENLVIDEVTFLSYGEIVPNKIEEINGDVDVKFCNFLDSTVDFYILIDFDNNFNENNIGIFDEKCTTVKSIDDIQMVDEKDVSYVKSEKANKESDEFHIIKDKIKDDKETSTDDIQNVEEKGDILNVEGSDDIQIVEESDDIQIIEDNDFNDKKIKDDMKDDKEKNNNKKNNKYYVCTKCKSFRTENKHPDCKSKYQNNIAIECLLGAFVVQEIIKMLKGDEFCENYQINL